MNRAFVVIVLIAAVLLTGNAQGVVAPTHTDAEGKIEWSADYSAWGERRHSLVLDKDEEAEQRTDCALRFQGQYYDAETGLHYNTFRYYDPGCGRFISPDPINLLGGLNLYQYAPNAANWIDPWGWSCGATKTAQNITKNAKNGKVLRGKDYHGRLNKDMEQQILSNPQGVYQAKNGNLIFHKDGNIVVAHGKGSVKGQVITSYGKDGARGESGAAIFGGSPNDLGKPVTDAMILQGKISKPDGGFIPPATQVL